MRGVIAKQVDKALIEFPFASGVVLDAMQHAEEENPLVDAQFFALDFAAQVKSPFDMAFHHGSGSGGDEGGNDKVR